MGTLPSKVVAKLATGDYVFAEYGEVWLAPCKVIKGAKFLENISEPRDFWRLETQGEGYSHYWSPKGIVSIEDATMVTVSANWQDAKTDPCSNETHHEWIMVTTESGVGGWTQTPGLFDGSDQFGGDDLSRAPVWATKRADLPPLTREQAYTVSGGPAPQAQPASAPELLATLAGRAFQGNARTKPKYANGPIARYDVQISVDDRGTATLRAGIASPPWSCTGNLTPTFVDGNRLTLEFGRTKGGDEIVIRCPNTGRISLMIGDPSGPQGFSWESLGEDNSSGSLAPLDAATFAEQQPPPDVDPCTESAWTGVIQMPIDLFICDQARAMMLFADGHDIAFNVPDSGLSLRDGWYYATFATRGTTIENTLKSMNVNGMKGWDEWFKVVNATIFYVTCAFNTADKPDLSPGARNVKAKLVQFSDGNLLFSCR